MQLSTLILFLIIPLVYYSKVYFKNWLNPIAIFFIPWLLMVVLFSLRIYNLNEPSYDLILLIIVTFMAFILGVEIYLIRRKTSGLMIDVNRLIDINKTRLIWAILILTLVSLVANIFILKNLILAEGNLFRIISRAAVVREKIVKREINVVSFYGYFGAFSYPAVIFSGVYASRYRLIKPLSWVSFIPVLLFSFIFMGRANVLWAILLYFNTYIIISYLIGKKFFTKRNIMISLFTFIVLMFLVNVVSFFRGGGQIRLYYKKYLRYEEPTNVFLRILYSNYPYVTTQLPALDILLERTDSPLLMGGKTFRPLILFAESKDKSHYYPFVRVPIPTNIYTYLGDVYMDFGLAGFIFVPFLMGFISMLFYSKSFSRPTIFGLAMTSVIYSQLEFSVLYSSMSFGNTWITISILVFLMSFFKKMGE